MATNTPRTDTMTRNDLTAGPGVTSSPWIDAMFRNDSMAGSGLTGYRRGAILSPTRPQYPEVERGALTKKRSRLKKYTDKIFFRKPSDTQNLYTSQGMFWQSPESRTKDFYPLVLLNIHAYLSEPKNILSGKERYRDCVWLEEFKISSRITNVFSFQPESFEKSLIKFKEAPDELITTLEQYNSDIRTRDVAEGMLKYALQDGATSSAFCFLMDKVSKAIENPRAREGGSLDVSDRMTGLNEAYENLEKTSDAADAANEQDQPPSFRANMRKFLLQSIEKDDGVDASLEKSWYVERYRAVSDVLATMDDKRCSKSQISAFLIHLSSLFQELQISTSHRHFDLATLAFVEIVSGARQHDFYEAIDVLRDMAVHRNQQHKYLSDQVNTLRDEVAKHRKIIVCLEYRHVLENLSLEGEDYLVNNKNKVRARLKKATPRWKDVWELAVETELLRMCQEKYPQLMPTVAPPVLPGVITSSATSTQPPSASVQAIAGPSGLPAASTHIATQSSPPVLDPPRLKSLLEYDFEFWYKGNNQKCSDIVKASVGALTPPKTAAISDIPYHEWSSYQHGMHLYGELSNEIHGYGEDYDVADATWLESHRKILEWLKPLSFKDDKAVDWAAEWSRRELPL